MPFLLDIGAGEGALWVAIMGAVVGLVRAGEKLLGAMADGYRRRRNGGDENGHTHRRHDDTREIAREAGATGATVTTLQSEVVRVREEAARTTERVAKVETRLDGIHDDLGEIKDGLATIHRRIDGRLG